MFEKEAEDKAFEKYPLSDRCDRIDLERNFKYEEGFQDGAEFGYNKANEWHYPSKGEYPKNEKDLLMSNQLNLLIKMKGSDCLSLALGQYNFSTQEFVYQHLVGLTEVYAWKEIALPEKESEA